MKTHPDNDNALLYSLGEAAQMLHCSTALVRRLAKSGLLEGLSLGGKSGVITRVTARSVLDFIDRAVNPAG